ncbi:uncharacterized protein EV420DRAFT_23298 [Desarmillaria tabescens]|uniref:Zn(2)-C6 fungal-type domain-containing protein n=1 Tax=Armillaria tabescens TaxID=1929756 RepID=A0AA39NP98_ARMTA|nr:uncharacterized protein EV420DRAFT_23298 [Desarmillaria tabescens]KAK0469315.1 hypothetical protein EV420DRAFT_23298 [Desarmillaria tabescens]
MNSCFTKDQDGNTSMLQSRTFECLFCPASFTRSTHLSRHLHIHTGERAYRCTACFAKFSRSDVLNRHAKTCKAINGQITKTVRRSRQMSCQACAQAKAKCDLEQPCSKCTTRGKDCVYVNDPAVSRHKRSCHGRDSDNPDTAPAAHSKSSASSPIDFSFSESAPGLNNDLVLADAFLFPACTPRQSGWLERDGSSEGYDLFTEHSHAVSLDSHTVPCIPSDSPSPTGIPSYEYTRANYRTAPLG